jgi:hypothetical protein
VLIGTLDANAVGVPPARSTSRRTASRASGPRTSGIDRDRCAHLPGAVWTGPVRIRECDETGTVMKLILRELHLLIGLNV